MAALKVLIYLLKGSGWTGSLVSMIEHGLDIESQLEKGVTTSDQAKIL